MKKSVFILPAVCALLLFTGCNSLSITTDKKTCYPLLSSAQGITMTPHFRPDKKNEIVTYHWTAEAGEFNSSGNEVSNQGTAVIWYPISDDQLIETDKPFDIRLEVLDTDSQALLASAKLTITPGNGMYTVK